MLARNFWIRTAGIYSPHRYACNFITARSSLHDRIRGLKNGADELYHKTLSDRGTFGASGSYFCAVAGKSSQLLKVGDVEIHLNSRTVLKAGIPVDLTVKEFDLLVELVHNKNVALYRERIYERVWGEPFTGETRTLDSHIQRLRRKLGWEDKIKTVFRIGYRLEV